MKRNKTAKLVFSFLGLFLLSSIGMFFSIDAKAKGNDLQQVLVVYKNTQGKEAILSKSQKVEKQFQNVPAVSATMTQQAIDNLQSNPNVAYVEPNVKFKVSDSQLKPIKSSSISANSSSSIPAEESQWDLQDSKAPLAWGEGITGKGVKVAILDTGIAAHPDLKIAGGVSMVSYTKSYADDNGHGTNIAGFVGALHNGIGMVGIAPDVQLYAVKVLDQNGEGTLSDVLSGIDWAISNHMNIINLSFGTTEDSQLLHDMVDKASQNGVLVVCASGNSGNAQGTGDNIDYPAKYSSVLSVSAVDSNMVRASFSSTGDKIDFAAPGVNVVSTYLDDSYAIGSGTSQATPHVTGLLALLKQKYPTKTNDELVSILKSYAIDLGAPGKDPWYGNGFAQYQATLPATVATAPTLGARGYVDTPQNGSVITGQADVRGWFLDGSGVAKIEVFVDGKSMGAANYGTARQDVEKVFPQYQNANSGYQYTLNTNGLSNGQHLLSIRETGKNGTTTVLGSIKINVLNLLAKGYMDTPVNGSTISGNSLIRGWFLDQKGVSKVNILVDGQNTGTAAYGTARLDVQKAFPQYQNADSGYQYNLNTLKMIDGKHSITVQEIGKDGTVTTLTSVDVNVQNTPSKGYIDAPAYGTSIAGEVNVRGWFLDGSGVSKIEVLVDGKSMGTAAYGTARLDVEKAYPQYQNADSGYQYTLNTNELTNGQHLLSIRETGKNGITTVINSIKINVVNLTAKGYMDTPVNGTTISKYTIVRGWFLDGSGVSKIEVFVDGKSMGAADYGTARLDVEKVFPQYQNANSGYQYALNTNGLSNGQHLLSIRETGKNGTTTVLESKKINVVN